MSSDEYVEMVYSRTHPSTPAIEKTLAHCASHGCKEQGTFAPYDFAPNVRFCERHATALIVATVRKVLSEPEED